jgi:hypothetical protein
VTSSRRAFFFPHALEASLRKNGTPGRVRFDVSANLVDTIGRRTLAGAAAVCGDGYLPNVVGSNQDPCIFAGPLHVFCRIDSTRADNCVKGTGKPLSHVVSSGDVVFFGKFDPKGSGPTESVWVDTVLVVERTVPWTTSTRAPKTTCKNPHCKAKPFTLTSPVAMAAKLAGNAAGASTAEYRYSLHDAETTGMHCCTRLDRYKVIVGKHAHDVDAVTNLMTSYVTLADQTEHGDRPASITSADMPEHWAALLGFIDTAVRPVKAGPNGGWIAELPDFALASALSAAIVAASGRAAGTPGTVVIPPAIPAVPVHRWSNVTCTASVDPV